MHFVPLFSFSFPEGNFICVYIITEKEIQEDNLYDMMYGEATFIFIKNASGAHELKKNRPLLRRFQCLSLFISVRISYISLSVISTLSNQICMYILTSCLMHYASDILQNI